ncbi:RICIN domain-containing protein [Streptomyces sp. NPDC048197]|uniref:RICIN domain-containing protein n=1 Tax=Streptomyces sp. NPDC048197 TaxID=3365511 RepID=UPI00372145C7
MKTKIKSALTAAVVATIALAASTGTAHANTYQRNVQLINHHTGLCLQGGGANVAVGLGSCNGSSNQRWNVLSYDSDVNNYYARVQIQSVATGQCMRWNHYTAGDGQSWDQLRTGSCDYTKPDDQWNLTWVGNTAPNPGNSFQFFNPYGVSNDPACLDAGQGSLMFGYGRGTVTCPWHTDDWQIWSMQG